MDSITSQRYKQFWRDLLRKWKKQSNKYFMQTSPRSDGWLQATAWKSRKKGQSGVCYGFVLNMESAKVELLIYDVMDMNSKLWDYLRENKLKIDSQFGSGVDWHVNKTAHLRKVVMRTGLNNEAEWSVIQDAMIHEMRRLISVCEPYLVGRQP